MRFAPLILSAVLSFGSAAVFAQQAEAPVVAGDAGALIQSGILTVDLEALFEGSEFRRSFDSAYQSAAQELLAENLRIEEALTSEERSLAERRPDMDPVEFRAEADAFAAKVDEIRAAQDAKEAQLDSMLSDARQAFISAASPVLGEIMRERGAVVILDRRTVFMTRSTVDVTEAAIERINAEIGDGTTLIVPQE